MDAQIQQLKDSTMLRIEELRLEKYATDLQDLGKTNDTTTQETIFDQKLKALELALKNKEINTDAQLSTRKMDLEQARMMKGNNNGM